MSTSVETYQIEITRERTTNLIKLFSKIMWHINQKYIAVILSTPINLKSKKVKIFVP